jgi:sugar phosphate isomerase/epimerase
LRLGTTSYIIPDNIIPNARYLADKVDDIQLILFQSEDISLPTDEDVRILQEIAEGNDLTYSIHFPLDTVLGAEEPLRSQSVEKHIEIINTTLPLAPSAYIVHFNSDDKAHQAGTPSDDMARWLANNRKSMEEILAAVNVPSKEFCVETLSFPLDLVDDIIEDLNLSVCLDIGHLIVNGYSVEEHLDRYLDKTKSIHLHGTSGSNDHLDLSHLNPKVFDLLLPRITERDLNLTVEVFNEENFLKSMKTLEEYRSQT